MQKQNTKISALIILLLVGLAASQSSAAIIIVDCNGPSDFNSIQEAIDSVIVSGMIEVRPGLYYENISYYGKTIVMTSTDPNDPNVVELTIIDGNSLGNVVTFNNGEDQNCQLAGFTIQNGATGIYCYLSEPLIRNCVVKSNTTGIEGPASPKIIETIVRDNSGTGINGCDGDISDCNIITNSGDGLAYCGGNMENCLVTGNGNSGFHYCGGQVLRCEVTGNGSYGFDYCIDQVVENCVITANGGVGYNGNNSSLKNCLVSANGSDGVVLWSPSEVSNCTIVGNNGNGIVRYSGSSVVSKNNIIVKNAGYGLVGSSTSYNNVWQNLLGDYSGVSPGTDDISQNPIFAAAGYWDMSNNWVEGEYHLMSAAGRWDVNDWVYDDFNSPCIDAGDPCSPIGVEPNPNGGVINQGVYGGTAQASKSPSGIVEPVCANPPLMDTNGDCKIDFIDFLSVIFLRSKSS
ncbi:MAG: right-handed parallel beta-helix repeat-containing protein [Planctomycetota bacterium]|jgi:hypothetical protein